MGTDGGTSHHSVPVRVGLRRGNAEALAGLVAEGLSVEDRDGAWVVSGGTRNPMRLAARVVTELVAPKGVAVVASNGVRSIIMVRRGQVLAMADSTVRRWRIYQVLPPSTPASIFNGSEGVPPARQTAPLLPVPAEVLTLGVDMDLDVDVGRLVGEFLPSAVRNARGDRRTGTGEERRDLLAAAVGECDFRAA